MAKGEKVECMENTPWASQSIIDGEAFIEGPHYPKPHTWYGKAVVEGGYIVKVT